MVKSLALQAELAQEFGTCVFDVTLDCEDGAPVGAEVDHAFMVAALASQALTAINKIASSSLVLVCFGGSTVFRLSFIAIPV